MKYWVIRNRNTEDPPGSVSYPIGFDTDRLGDRDVILWSNSKGTQLTHWSSVVRKSEEDRAAGVTELFKPAITASEILKEIPENHAVLDQEQVNALIRFFKARFKKRGIPEGLVPSLKFEEVLADEILKVGQLRRKRGRAAGIGRGKSVLESAHGTHLTGLAFSGGGIRSATFNLGVLQALAKKNLLPCFDYLSTVSGGGYIGSWLVAWIARTKRERVEEELPAEHSRQEPDDDPKSSRRFHPIAHLRRFSNYLTPKLGMFSADRWTLVATYGRNLSLNLLILVLFLSALLFFPRLVVSLTEWLSRHPDLFHYPAFFSALIGVTAVFISFMSIEKKWSGDFLINQKAVQLLVVVPLFISGWMGSGWIRAEVAESSLDWEWWRWTITGCGIYTVIWLIAIVLAAVLGLFRKKTGVVKWSSTLTIFGWAIPAGCAGGLLLWQLANFLEARNSLPAAMAFGPPLFIMVIIFTAVLHVGLLGRAFEEKHRQWWSRLGAWLMIYALVWIFGFAVSLYSPAAVRYLPTVWGGIGLGWVGSTMAGLWASRGTGTGAFSRRIRKLLVIAAPYIFIAGLIVLLALGVQAVLEALKQVGPIAAQRFSQTLARAIENTWTGDAFPFWQLAAMALGLGFAAWVLSLRVDINDFSMHLFYRSRLVRAYLGASNFNRKAQPFTHFDPNDDVDLARILSMPDAESPYSGPLPIINTALNLAASKELAWQERKAASFIFTPLHYGFDQKLKDEGPAYRPLESCPERGGISLGTALTISGAAVNPGMGYHSVPSLAFLMTVFNARLGWWLRNPGYASRIWRDRPTSSLWWLLAELFSQTRSTSRFVNLADGGFFDNLGIYELVKRRCSVIVACDAEADGDLTFGGLGNAVRKIRSDLGIDVKLDVEPIKDRDDNGFSKWHCAVGTIFYDKVDPGKPHGTLIYIKSSLTGDEPEDVAAYSEAHDSFPHESTADQWFSESQFESYRQLGFHAAQEVFAVAKPPAEGEEIDIEKIAVDLRQAWYRPSIAVQKSFTTHARLLDEIFERIRKDEHLKFLDSEIYMELAGWQKGRPHMQFPGAPPKPKGWDPYYVPTDEEFRAGFYLCNSVIQLMENVYIDLDLAHEWGHPDNRGWMNLFKHWSWSRMFRQTWAVSACTYGARFQSFCERRLGLELGTVWGDKGATDEQIILHQDGIAESAGRLNYLECLLVHRLQQEPEFAESIKYVMPLEVHVLHPREAHRRKLYGEKGVPDRNDMRRTLLSFTIGFAILDQEFLGDQTKLVFMRIRDHLRKLGLGRQALRYLKEQCNVRDLIELDKATGVRILNKVWPGANWEQFKSIFESVMREQK